ncbi:hypothetical protein [Thiorhodococcus mannitoliphagus]|uniref:hypothetical protein n=1 Tax=Thiorhodococcus mannitoliphagus TaxID=329406 RepID=UPI001981EDDB|nr:hypothetical protein [Thiorhodococcus mannitoliphagus]
MRHQLPSGLHVLSRLRFGEETWLKLALSFTNRSDSPLDRIEILPPSLSQKAQPDIQDRGPNSDSPVWRIERKDRKLALGQSAPEVSRAITEHSDTTQPNEPFGGGYGLLRPCQRPCDLERLGRDGRQLRRMLLILQRIE